MVVLSGLIIVGGAERMKVEITSRERILNKIMYYYLSFNKLISDYSAFEIREGSMVKNLRKLAT